MAVDALLFLTLACLVAVTCYTDWMSRRIPNKALIAALVCALVLHGINGTFFPALQTMVVCFGMAFLFYVTRIVHISPGDVKLFAVLGAIAADLRTMLMCWFFFSLFHLMVAIWVLWRETRFRPKVVMRVLKLDFVGFVSRTAPVIEPVQLPAAVPIGLGALLAHLLASI
jgi:Flp pilus assembly protein protease CpaA